MPDHSTFDEFDLLKRLRSSERIFDRLRELSGSELQIQSQLRREFPDDIVRAAVNLGELRRKGAAKFSRADEMWFDRKGLEQSTPEAVARHKSKRFSGQVWDYCCGIGSDAIAMAEHCDVAAVDSDPARCLEASWNSQVYGVENRIHVVCADVQDLAESKGLVHIDPDRRAGGQGRSIRIEECVPGPEFLEEIIRKYSGGAIKLSPASNFSGKFRNVEIELTSLSGECKEATIWFGELSEAGKWRATVLPTGESVCGDPLEATVETGPLCRYLYDPDPAVVRSGLLELVAERLDLRRLDESEEYLTSQARIDSPFVRGFEVLAELPNNEREIRSWFRKKDFGQVEIKCRRIPIQVEAVRRKLPLNGSRPAVLIFARIHGKARSVICQRISAS